jgi:hypothetical protein
VSSHRSDLFLWNEKVSINLSAQGGWIKLAETDRRRSEHAKKFVTGMLPVSSSFFCNCLSVLVMQCVYVDAQANFGARSVLLVYLLEAVYHLDRNTNLFHHGKPTKIERAGQTGEEAKVSCGMRHMSALDVDCEVSKTEADGWGMAG